MELVQGPRRLSATVIDIWLLDPASASEAWIERHIHALAPEEKARIASLGLDRLRHEYVCTRIMQRQVLSRYADADPVAWRFVEAPQGKPSIGEPENERGIRFNLSHTGGLIALALCRDAEIGVDVEMLDRESDVTSLARRFFAPTETAALLALQEDAQRSTFFQLWTLKEACLKALGVGLFTPLDLVRFERSEDRALVPAFVDEALLNAGRWHTETLRPTREHILGLAVLMPPNVEQNSPIDVRMQWVLP